MRNHSGLNIPLLVPQIVHVRSLSELVLQPHASQVQRREDPSALFALSIVSLSDLHYSKLSNEENMKILTVCTVQFEDVLLMLARYGLSLPVSVRGCWVGAENITVISSYR
jgi:hypothetical protein